MSCEYIYEFSNNFWTYELGCPDTVSRTSISGWVTSSYTLGTLSNLTLSCFSGVSGCVQPQLGPPEFAILSEMYKTKYYAGLAESHLGAGGTRRTLEIAEGDSKIKWQNQNESAKVYNDMAKQAREQLKSLTRSYQVNGRGSNVYGIDYYNISR